MAGEGLSVSDEQLHPHPPHHRPTPGSIEERGGLKLKTCVGRGRDGGSYIRGRFHKFGLKSVTSSEIGPSFPKGAPFFPCPDPHYVLRMSW